MRVYFVDKQMSWKIGSGFNESAKKLCRFIDVMAVQGFGSYRGSFTNSLTRRGWRLEKWCYECCERSSCGLSDQSRSSNFVVELRRCCNLALEKREKILDGDMREVSIEHGMLRSPPRLSDSERTIAGLSTLNKKRHESSFPIKNERHRMPSTSTNPGDVQAQGVFAVFARDGQTRQSHVSSWECTHGKCNNR